MYLITSYEITQRNSKVPEEYRAPYTEAAISEACQGNCAGLQGNTFTVKRTMYRLIYTLILDPVA